MSAKEQVLNLLKENSEAMKAGEIAAALSIDKKEVYKAIKELKTDGSITSPKRCFYTNA